MPPAACLPGGDAADPAAVLYMGRQVQAESSFYELPVDCAAEIHTTDHDVDDVAGDEAHRQEYQHAQDEQGGDDQQQPPDDVGSHDAVTATRSLPPWEVRGANRLIQSPKGRVDSEQPRGAPLQCKSAQACPARLQWKPPEAVSSEAHFSLQILVNPKADEDAIIQHVSYREFTVKTFDPRLVHLKPWSHRTPYLIVLL